VALVLGIHRLMSQALTPTNLVGNAVATITVAKWEKALDETRLKRVLDGEATPAMT
jgi:aerobic C4-dicarboxylate transport protein